MIPLKVGRKNLIQCLICLLHEGCRYDNKKVAVTIIEAILHRWYAKCLFLKKFKTKFSTAEQIFYFVEFIRLALLQNTCERNDLFFGKY